MFLFIFLLVAVVSLAILGAGVFPWTVCLVAVTASAVNVWLSWRRLPSEPSATRKFPAVETLFAALLVFLVLSALPMPLALSRLTGPTRYEQNRTVSEFLARAVDLGLLEKRLAFFSMSRNRAGTLRIIVLAIAAFSIGSIASAVPAELKRAYLRLLLAIGALVAVLGYVSQWRISQGDTLWWVYPIYHTLPGPVACFINRNHYGGFLAILAPIGLGLLLRDLRRRQFLAAASSLCGFVLISAALLFSLSRGAVVAYGAGMVAMPLLLLRRRRILAGVTILVLAAAIAGGILFNAREGVRARLRSMANPTAEFGVRLDAWKTAVPIWRTYPLFGGGPNAFRMVFPQHRTSSRRSYMTHAENEYLETFADTGLVGVCLALLLGYAVLRPCFRRADPDSRGDGIGLAAQGTLAVAATHACFDFPLHLPLYTVALFSIVGLAHTDPAVASPRRRWIAAFIFTSALATSMFWVDMGRLDNPRRLRRAELPTVAHALTWAPTSHAVWYHFGRRARKTDRRKGSRFVEECASQAAFYDANSYRLWLAIGKMRLRLKDYPGARAAFKRVNELRYWVKTPPVPEE
ncbi:MAG: O-antigen ligase family protein [Lentisphaerae bacterium]|nr:O-antigen ligase family protein [Lentisphaerota bacterium]